MGLLGGGGLLCCQFPDQGLKLGCSFLTRQSQCLPVSRPKSPHLERADGGDPTVRLPLVIIARERPFQHGARVLQVHVLLHGDVAPVGDLDDAGHAGDGQEGAVVLRMHSECVLERKEAA